MRSFLGVPFAVPSYEPPTTAWKRHGVFANWLVKAARPDSIVELGSHYGFSYFAFCQAVEEAGLPTRCYAIDTWQGDEHAGVYGDEVFEHVSKVNARYATFSTLLRKTFAEALDDVPDGSVDLLHVDGRHFYEDVKEDFETWIPKLSPRAIVLFHDTEVRDRGFGVWQYWDEIRTGHPSFNFLYQRGLGVLFWGTERTPEIEALVALAEHEPGAGLIPEYFYSASENHVLSRKLSAAVKEVQQLGGDVGPEAGALSRERERNARLTEMLRVAQRVLRQPVRSAMHRVAVRIALQLCPWLSERRKSRLRDAVAKRDVRAIVEGDFRTGRG